MNQEKAREYFSAYHEGTLEPGIRQAFEMSLRSEPSLQADYAAFSDTIQELGQLSAEEVEIPIYLSDRIATRLEQEIVRRPRTAPGWAGWLRGTLIAGLGTVAIVGAIMSFHSSGSTSVADPFPAMPGGDQPTFAISGSAVVMSYHPSSQKTVVVSSAVSGREVQRFVVDATSPNYTFENKESGTALFQLQIIGDHSASLLALPGTSPNSAPASSGTIRDFAVALASRYHLPILVRAADSSKHFSWKLDGLDADHAANTALADEPYVVDQRENGVVVISDR